MRCSAVSLSLAQTRAQWVNCLFHTCFLGGRACSLPDTQPPLQSSGWAGLRTTLVPSLRATSVDAHPSLHETCLTTVLHARKHSPRHSLHPSRQSGQGAIAFHPSQVEIKLRSCWTPQQPAHSHPSCIHSTAVSPLDSVSQAARWVFERDLQSASGSCRSLCQQQSSRHLRHWAELGRCSRPCDQLPSFAASKPGRPSSKQLWPVPDAGASVSARPFAPWRLAMQFRPMTAFLAWSQACHCSQLVCFHTFQPTHEQVVCVGG